jgi:hypothetical protein
MWIPTLLAVAAQFGFQVDADEFANVVYNVSCLSDMTPCTRASIKKFWHEDLRWSDADEQQLAAWKSTLEEITSREPKGEEIGFLATQTAFYPRLALRRRILAAAFDSHSPAEFRRRASQLARPAEIATLSDSLGHFEQRMHPWWVSKGRPYAAKRLDTVRSLLSAPEIIQLAGRIHRFMEAENSSAIFHVHLIARSDPESDAANATPVGNHLLVELNDELKSGSKFAKSIILHEMTHTFYDAAPQQLQRDLIHTLIDGPEPQAQPLYALLNEGLATAVQWIVLADPTVSDEDLYRHPYIPRIGRAVAASLRDALEHGPTLYHGFLPIYMKAAAAELKDELASPRFILTSAILAPMIAPGGNLDESEKAYQSNFVTTYSASPGDRDRFKEMNLVILITYDKLDAIADTGWDQAVPLSKAHRGFVLSAPRGHKGHAYVFAGRDEQTLVEVIKRAAAIRTAVPEGLVSTLDSQ